MPIFTLQKIQKASQIMVAHNKKKPMFEGVRLLLCGDPGFPSHRTYAPHFPERLWYRGSFLEKDVLSVAIVGSRECTELGARRAFRLAKELGDELGKGPPDDTEDDDVEGHSPTSLSPHLGVRSESENQRILEF